MKFPVFDFHCDTALALMKKDSDEYGDLYDNQLHIDLKRARLLDGYAQCFACFTTTPKDPAKDLSSDVIFAKELHAIQANLEQYSDIISLARTVEEVNDNFQSGKISAILTLEGSAGIGFSADKLEELYQTGFRVASLGWNELNPLTGSCVTGGGLSEKGKAYVREAQRLGMVVDVSHISDEGFWDIMDITQKPIIATHSNSRALCNVPRNLTDDMYLSICKSGGTAGINLCNEFLGQNPDIDTICDHILHFMDIAGSDEHVSLGSDFDGCPRIPKGIEGVQDYPKLAERLLQRGLVEQSVRKVFWDNALGVMRKCSM